MSDTPLNDAIRETSMLVSLHTTKWTATAGDEAGAREAERAKGAKRGTRSTRQKLMAGHDAELRAVTAIQDGARAFHIRNTLPWGQYARGPRLIPTTGVMDYLKTVGEYKTALEKAKAAFLDVYEERREAAIADVVADASLYPTRDQLERMFTLTTEFTPIAKGSQFNGLPDQVMQRMSQTFEDRLQRSYHKALNASVERATEALSAFADKMENVSRVYKSTWESVEELPEQLRRFNILGDASIVEIARAIEEFAGQYSLEELKENDVRRIHAARDARDLIEWCKDRWEA